MIDLCDTIVVFIDDCHYRTKYRCYCDTCGRDRGYICKQSASKPNCNKCSHILISDNTRLKMSFAKKGKKPHNKNKKGISEKTRTKMRNAKKGNIPKNKGSVCEQEKKIKISCTLRKINKEDFVCFANSESKRQRDNNRAIEARNKCFKEANYTCQVCARRGVKLNAHHKNSWKFFPELRYEHTNLVCICIDCHKRFHKIYGTGVIKPNVETQFLEFIKNTLA